MDTARLKCIKHVALDLDGTIYKGGTLFPWSLEFLRTLDECSISYTFLTNNSSKGSDDYLKHLRGFGIPATPEQLYTSGLATIDFLKTQQPPATRIFLVGTESLKVDFRAAGFTLVDEDPQLVVIGFNPNVSYTELCKAGYWIKRGCDYVPTHPDVTCPTDQETMLLDVGSLCACLEVATGKKPLHIPGKPSPAMLAGILKRHSLTFEQLAMAGDRLDTDLRMANRSGAFGVFVLSGVSTEEDLKVCDFQPDLVVPNLGSFGELLKDLSA